MEGTTEKDRLAGNTLPKWLRKLAKESWQAELLISGIAILGAAQLPGVLFEMSDWFILNVRFEYLWVFDFVMVYLGVGCLILLFNFSIHFAMRTFWVGIVGLSSVFPKGIGPHREMVKDYYVEDVKKNYPNLQQIIIRTEKACSIIFSATALLVMIFLGISTVLIGFVLLAMLIDWLSNGMIAFDNIMTYVVGGLFVMLMLVSMLNYTPLIKKPKVEKFMLRYSRITRKLFNPLFDKSGAYLSLVFITQLSLKGVAKYGFVYYILVMFSYFSMISSSSLRLMSDPERNIHEAASRTDRVYKGAYLDERVANVTYFQPAIAKAHYKTGEAMEIIIPELADDSYWIDEGCTIPEVDDALSGKNARMAKRERSHTCASTYWQVAIDGETQPFTPQRYRLTAQPDGWMDRIVLPITIEAGKHDLMLRTRRDTGYVVRARIPFWVERG